MVAWFIIAITTLAVFAFIAVNGVSNVSTATDAVGRVEVARKLDAAVTALLARSASPNDTGSSYLLAGTVINGVYTLPVELSSLASTPFGQQIVYCPFGGLESGTASTVTSANTTSYAIQTAQKGGRSYVIGGRPSYPGVAANPNLMGWLMAPRTKTSQPPSCNEVRFNPNTGKFEASDAIVRPIIREGGSRETRDALSREVAFFVSQTGNGNGLTAADPASFTTALDYYRTRQPSSMTIQMANGFYILPTGMLSLDGVDRGVSGSLTIRGSGSTYIDQQARAAISVPGALKLENLIFDTDTILTASSGNRVETTNVTVGGLIVTGGAKATATNLTVNFIGPDSAPIVVQQNGELDMMGTNVIGGINGGSGIVLITGGQAQLQGTYTYRMSSGSGSFSMANVIQAGTNMTLRGAAIYFANPANQAFSIAGDFSSHDSNIQFASAGTYAGFVGHQGGRINLSNGSMIGSAPSYGIIDLSASYISGETFTLRGATRCWFSDPAYKATLFTESDTGTAGKTSSVLTDATVPVMNDPPTRAQIEAYSTATKTNARRAALRAMNTTSWQCAA